MPRTSPPRSIPSSRSGSPAAPPRRRRRRRRRRRESPSKGGGVDGAVSKASSYAAAAVRASASAGRPAGTDPAREKSESPANPPELSASAPARGESRGSRAADDDDDDDDAPASGRLDARLAETLRRNPRLAATYWRLRRQHDGLGPDASEAEREAIARSISVGDGDSFVGFHAGSEKAAARGARCGFPAFASRPRTSARVFEVGVALTYGDEPSLLLAALTELREGVLADLPPQALLQRPTALDAAVALARGVGGFAPAAVSRFNRGGDREVVSPGRVRAPRSRRSGRSRRALRGALGHQADGAYGRRSRRSGDGEGGEGGGSGGSGGSSSVSDFSEAGSLATLPAAHLIASAVIPMLAMPGDVAGDALLVLGEALPLLELSDVDSGEGSSGAGFHQQKDGGSPDAASTAARLGAYLVGISDALSGAAVAASVDGVDDSLPTSECPAFSPRSA